MDQTPNLKLPYILAAQSQKHVTHNEAIRALDALTQITVADRNLASPPASPVEGSRYIVAAGGAGAWAGQSGRIAAWHDAAWMFYAPVEGWIAWIADEDIAVVWNGTSWTALSSGGGGGGSVNPTPLVGVNATADPTNRLSVSSPASLFNHAGSGHQIKINKAAAADTASVLFQDAFSGRAEFGLAGDDNFHVKVSPDGTTFFDAIVIDRATGAVNTPLTGPDIQVYSTAGSFTWTKPAWANANSIVEVQLLGGGGGGASGRRGAAGTVRCGGGGGASGTYTSFKLKAGELAATVAVTVGAGGAGGAAVAVDTTNGNTGTAGGTSTFGTLRAVGGAAGNGGTASSGAGGAAAGLNAPFTLAALAGGAASTTGLAGTAGGTGAFAAGGAGGGISSANAVANGGTGGISTSAFSTLVGAAGTAGAAGGNGGNGSPAVFAFAVTSGSGGGGGASSITAAAGNGGNGANGGGGGGGGGASLNGFASGAGGAGGSGWVIVETYR